VLRIADIRRFRILMIAVGYADSDDADSLLQQEMPSDDPI